MCLDKSIQATSAKDTNLFLLLQSIKNQFANINKIRHAPVIFTKTILFTRVNLKNN